MVATLSPFISQKPRIVQCYYSPFRYSCGATRPGGSQRTVPLLLFYPRWYVCTTRVYVLLCCCCCCSCSCGHITQNTALLSNFTMLSAYCTVACTLARQPCMAALPLAALPPAALPPAALPPAAPPCLAALPGSSTNFDQI
jgi:hypothetical protein